MRKRARELSLVIGLAWFGLLLLPAGALALGDVTVIKEGPGAEAATVVSDPSAPPFGGFGDWHIHCGDDCHGEFISLSEVKVNLIATPGAGDVLIGWSVEVNSSPTALCQEFPAPNPCTVTVAMLIDEFTVRATFGPPPAPPQALTDAATGVDAFRATLNGRVNPEGSFVGDCHFEYGTTTAYGATLPCFPAASELGEDAEEHPVNARTPPLEAGTTYHYRLVAANPGGASRGADHSFVTAGAPVCPNAERRVEQGIATILLPACMALEQVSPSAKDNQPARFPTVSNSGERVGFISAAALAGNPGVIGSGEAYVATRAPSGWRTAYTRAPAALTRMWSGGAKGFSPDLGEWVQLAATQPQAERGEGQAFSAGLGGLLEPLSPPLVPVETSARVVEAAAAGGVSADRSHLFFTPGPVLGGSQFPYFTALLAGDPRPLGTDRNTARNAYVAHLAPGGAPSLELLARGKPGPGEADEVWGGTCGAEVGGPASARGAISADGAQVYFSTRSGQPEEGLCRTEHRLRILARSETPAGTLIEEPIEDECARVSPQPPCKSEAELNGDDSYLGASLDQSRLYLATVRQLASSDSDETSDVYLYDATKPAGDRLTQVTAGEADTPTPGSGAGVAALFALSGDGSRVYFASKDVLTGAANPEGKVAEGSARHLYLWDYDSGLTSFVGDLASADRGAYPVPLVGADPAVGGDGHVLLFNSSFSFGGKGDVAADADGGLNDVYRYDAAAQTLDCVSCLGVEDSAPFAVAVRGDPFGTTDFAERGRWASEDGGTVVLKTAERLVPGDANRLLDSYLWSDGRFHLLPGTADPVGTVNPERGLLDTPSLSHDGAEVAFHSAEALLPTDRDSVEDVYVARAGGGFAFPPPPPEPCAGEACQGPVPAPPPSRTPAAPSGEGNPPPGRDRCRAVARRAQRLTRRAKGLRRRAQRAAPRRARSLRLRSQRLTRRGRALARRAHRCRHERRRTN